MRTVGTFEAKTRLSSLLEQVEKGAEITITRHGKPVARLLPAEAVTEDRKQKLVERLKSFRKGRRLGELTIKGLIETGRR
jgi:prevent-host-death family protein